MKALLKIHPAEGDAFEVEISNTATIGRSRDNTVGFDKSPQVSRQHAIIRCQNAWQYQIMDLGSRNGTFVDGRRVITPTVLRDGAIIRICNNEITFHPIESEQSPGVADVTLASGTSALEESATVAIMVCDLRGFSTMSEFLPEDQLARTLGEWFRSAGEIVQSSGGMVDKFIGDAILAYWVRGDAADEAARAFETGRTLLQKAAERHWPHDPDERLRIAVALHHGTVTCGNIGLVAQRDATIIGDAVNTTFRIEALMKSFPQKLVCTGDFVDQLSAASRSGFTDLGDHQLKGKNQLVRLLGWES